MFGRLAAVRIRAAEDAFSKGRLDEAFEIAAAEDLAGDRHARRLLKKLAEPLLQRGQDHLLSKRFSESLADFERAARCGHQAKKIDEWRKRALDAMEDDQKVQHDKDAALAAAGERLAAGSLHTAADALAKAPTDDPDRAALSDAIARQTRRAAEALAAAKAALKNGHLAEAVARWKRAEGLHTQLDGITDMEAKLVAHAVSMATEDFKNGRLKRAEQDLAVIGDIGRARPEHAEMHEVLRLAREAAHALSDDRYARASVLLGRLTQIGPKTGWISDVRGHLNVLEEHRRALLEGPLGLLSGQDVPTAVGPRAPGGITGSRRAGSLGRGAAPRGGRTHQADETLPAGPPGLAPGASPTGRAAAPRRLAGPGAPSAPHHGFLPKRLLLRIDGVGSFLLLRGDRVSIGRAGPGASADLQLISDLSERQAEIIRAGEDYFVVSNSGVELAGRQVDHALLQDGDRIRLGKRIRLKFRRPSLKSTTAALDLGDGVRTTTDCRRVILWSGPLLMGPARECHVRLSPGLGGAILMERGGQLCLKPMGPGGRVWHGRPAGVATAETVVTIPLGVQTEVGDLRLSIQPWSGRSSAGRVIG
jgi:tetratricopeptide (TPR) repeat protein